MFSAVMKAAGGATMGHSGQFDYNGANLTGKKQLRRQPTVETSGTGKRRRVVLKSTTSKSGNLNSSASREQDPVYDGHLLANMGPQRLTSLSLKVGHRLAKLDNIGRYLKNLMGNGRVVSSWNCRILSDIDERNVHMELFRHRLSKDNLSTSTPGDVQLIGNVINDTYPTVSLVDNTPLFNVFFPNTSNTSNTYPMNAVLEDKPVTGDKISNAFYTIANAAVYWCPLNRGDLEDMSWNLNKMKLNNQEYITPVTPATDPQLAFPTAFCKNTPVFEIGKHRRQSAIQQCNQAYVDWNAIGPYAVNAGGGPETKSTLCPYAFDAVLRFGTLDYEFQNKLDTGATVEIVVYRVKKNATMPGNNSVYTTTYDINRIMMDPGEPVVAPGVPIPNPPTVDVQYPLSLLGAGIGRGYLATVADKYGTDDLIGRRPLASDIFNDPRFPLLPNLKKTKESTVPFSEVMRNKFVLTAGSRRSVKIELPGDVYDPSMIKTRQQLTPGQAINTTEESGGDTIGLPYKVPETDVTIWPVKASEISILDDHSYCAVISVNGQKMTRFFDNPGRSGSGISGVPTDWQVHPDSSLTYTQNSDLLLLPPGTNFDVGSNLLYVQHLPSEFGDEANTTVLDFFCESHPAAPTGQTWPADYHLKVLNVSMVKSGSGYEHPGTFYRLSTSVSGGTANISVGFGSGMFDPAVAGSALVHQPLMFSISSFEKTTPTVLPSEFPMGDSFGTSHVDYCCNYTEHIGACIYKESSEVNLYVQGQPEAPTLKAGAATGSQKSARIILPATTAVRQGNSTSVAYNSSGDPSAFTHNNGSSNIGGSA